MQTGLRVPSSAAWIGVGVAAALLAGAGGLGVWRGWWALTALPLGALFGFVLHKGGLCGAAAFSEVLILREGGKLWGLWVGIVSSMAAFTLLDLLGWVTLAPKPMIWLSYLVGGLVFGVGMVLAGGCVSGCLFKGAAGNVNSLAGLAGIPLGIAMVETGPLREFGVALREYTVRATDGGAVTIGSLLGMPFWAVTLLVVAATGAGAWAHRRRRPARTPHRPAPGGPRRRVLTAGWRPWAAGLALGVLAAPLYLTSAAVGRNYPIGVTHGVLHVMVVATESPVAGTWGRPAPRVADATAQSGVDGPTTKPARRVNWWLIMVVTGLMIGSHLSARLAGPFKWRQRTPEELMVSFGGGLLVGLGAALATGCVIGNILSGWALQSGGLLVFGAAVLLANWAATWVYLMGGLVRQRRG